MGEDFDLGHGEFDRHISRQVEQNDTHLGKSFNLCACFPPLTMLTPTVPTAKTFGKIKGSIKCLEEYHNAIQSVDYYVNVNYMKNYTWELYMGRLNDLLSV